jgi:hypothetical protein
VSSFCLCECAKVLRFFLIFFAFFCVFFCGK